MKKITNQLPGLIFTTLLAGLAVLLQRIELMEQLHLSSLIIAILLGVLINNLISIPASFKSGIKFSAKKVLRLAIIMLGFKLSFTQVASIGGRGLVQVIIVSTATMLLAAYLGKKMNLRQSLALLIGAGTSICGASAVAAVAPVVDGTENDISYAVGAVTLFSTVAMFLYPILFNLLNIPALIYSVWAGSSIHGVAQAVAAGFAGGEQAGEFATLVKLTRVLLVIPTVLILGFRQARRNGEKSLNLKKLTIPWFVFGFLLTVIINSLQIIPRGFTTTLVSIDHYLLTLAMAGMGLETNLTRLKKVGLKPFYLGITLWFFIGLFAYLMASVFFS